MKFIPALKLSQKEFTIVKTEIIAPAVSSWMVILLFLHDAYQQSQDPGAQQVPVPQQGVKQHQVSDAWCEDDVHWNTSDSRELVHGVAQTGVPKGRFHSEDYII